MKKMIGFSLIGLVLLFACKNKNKPADITTESKKFNATLDSIYDVYVAMSPVSQTYLGIKDRQFEWDISNDSMDAVYHEMTKNDIAFIKTHFDPKNLDKQAALSYRMWLNDKQESIANYKWRYHNYPVNQMFGSHTWFPTFLMNVHTITNKTDAEAWIARVSKIDVKVDELIAGLNKRAELGIIAPKFVYPYVLSDCENLIKGYPFDKSEAVNPLLEDFTNDLNLIDSVIDEKTKKELINNAEIALIKTFQPAYLKLIDAVKAIESQSTTEDGIWKLPQGEEYYNVLLKGTTTTNYTAEEIFELGEKEVARIHLEMEEIMKKVNFKGDLNAFFTYMETEESFYYPNTKEGKQAYLDKNIALIDEMKTHIDELFNIKPKAKLEVVAVEPFREQSEGEAFYNSAAPDGSRPGYYYVNLYNMRAMPKYEMEALSFHEAIPGHHMQISIAQELENLPKYRTQEANYTAYSEGWGLYSEYIPKEIGFYTDPYSDFGRLSMELWRACRLVADVGIHVKKWTREESIAYYKKNTPASDENCKKMVERHIVMPSQATAYKIGQLKILALRNSSRETLGKKFDIRAFHDVVLTNGPVPLNILEELVTEWVSKVQKP